MRKKRRKKRERPYFPLKELLRMKGWSQRQLAASSEIDLSQINALATNKVLPTWGTILRIATTVGADLGDLQPGKGGAA